MMLSFFKYLLMLSLFSGIWEQFNKIAITNGLKSRGEKAFARKDYKQAAAIYDSLLSYYKLQDETIRLNLAHSLFKMEDRRKAAEQYKILSASSSTRIASVAFQQQGVIAALKGKTDEAIAFFKKALITDPGNENARYNLELVGKLKNMEADASKKSKKSGGGSDKGAGQKNKGGSQTQEGTVKDVSESGMDSGSQGEEEKGGGMRQEGDSGEETQGSSEEGSGEEDTELKKDEKGTKEEEAMRAKRLGEINLSEQKARQILEEMKNEESQYIQQMKKHQSGKEYKGKPDW